MPFVGCSRISLLRLVGSDIYPKLIHKNPKVPLTLADRLSKGYSNPALIERKRVGLFTLGVFIMSMVIGTNVASLTAQRHLSNSQAELGTSMERLSSGSRINSATDDAAGLAISDRMTSQVNGLNQGIRNASDAMSLGQTAEGALDESTAILQRMRDLAVQASNGTNTDVDKTAMNDEVTQLKAELTRISDSSTFNGAKLLDGNFTAKTFQIGHMGGDTVSLSLNKMDSTSLGDISGASAGTVAGSSTATQQAASADSKVGGTVAIQGGSNSAAAVVAADSIAGTTVVSGTAASSEVAATTWTDTFTVSAVAADGDAVSWDLGSGITAAYTVVSGDDKTDVNTTATAIASGLSASGFTFSASSGVITATRDAGAYSAEGAATVTQPAVVAATNYTDTFQITTNAADGDDVSWNLGDETVAYTLTVSGGDDVTNAASSATSLAAGLTAAATGYTFAASGDTITATRTAAGAHSTEGVATATGTLAGSDGTATAGTASSGGGTLAGADGTATAGTDLVAAKLATQWQGSQTFTAGAKTGDVINFTIGGDAHSYTATADTTTAGGLTNEIAANMSIAGYSVGSSGNDVVINKNAAGADASGLLSAVAQRSAVTASSEMEFVGVSAAATSGDKVTISVNGDSYTHAFTSSPATAAATIDDMVSDWNAGTTGFRTGYTAVGLTAAGVETAATDSNTVSFALKADQAGTAGNFDMAASFQADPGVGGSVAISAINLTSSASDALSSIDQAIKEVGQERSKLGAFQNRLEHTVSNLQSMVENTSAARSRIQDTDFAAESANLAKAQVLQQAGTAMLAQANASGQSVLSLLK